MVFFLIGFSKNEKDNINKNELDILKQYTKMLLNLNEPNLEKMINVKELIEVKL